AGNLTTAKDLAILIYHLIREFPSILDTTKELSFTVLPDSLYEETFETDNDSLYSRPFAFKGTDGLKTSQSTTGFNAIMTAKQNGLRVITVLTGIGDVLRPESKQALFPISNTLMEQVFDNYEYKEIISAGQQELHKQTIQVENDWYAVIKKGEQPTFTLKDNQLTLTEALPIISDSVAPLTASYREVTLPVEKNIEQHTFLAKIVNVVEITKLTILALGIALLGLIFLLMSFFIPIVPDKKRKNTHQKRSRISLLPTKKIIRWVGIGFCLIGFSILFIQYIL
nr:DUF1958 domain-containing protein [Enterococcus sp.]